MQLHKYDPLPREAASHAEEVVSDWSSAQTLLKLSFYRELVVHCLSPAGPTTPIRSFSSRIPGKTRAHSDFSIVSPVDIRLGYQRISTARLLAPARRFE